MAKPRGSSRGELGGEAIGLLSLLGGDVLLIMKGVVVIDVIDINNIITIIAINTIMVIGHHPG